MGRVGLLADDLTGALDAAAPFATSQSPVAVVWSRIAPQTRESFAVDSETRQSLPHTAVQRVTEVLPALGKCGIAFKKIDSLMRGNTLGELRACCSSNLFGTVVIAPAFPEQGRVTRGGRQFSHQGDGAWIPTCMNIAEDLACENIPARVIGSGSELAGGGVAICDAETELDLEHVVSAKTRLAEPVLWCGSAGLARALGTADKPVCQPQGHRRLFVVGSVCPTSVQQVERVRRDYPQAVTTIHASSDIEVAVARIAHGLTQHGSALLALSPPDHDRERASDLYRKTFAHLMHVPPPDILVAVGGDTLYRLCGSVGASRLDAIGEWKPGVAVSKFVDGLWAGTVVISKSGAFGKGDCLLEILARTEGV